MNLCQYCRLLERFHFETFETAQRLTLRSRKRNVLALLSTEGAWLSVVKNTTFQSYSVLGLNTKEDAHSLPCASSKKRVQSAFLDTLL